MANKKNTIECIQIVKQIQEDFESYESLYEDFSSNFESLSSVRMVFPQKLLYGADLAVFLKKKVETQVNEFSNYKKMHDDTDKKQQELEKIETLLNKEYEQLKKTSGVDKTSLETKEIQIKKNNIELKKNKSRKRSIKTRLSSIQRYHLEENPERVKYFYEDLIMFTINCRHESLELHKRVFTMAETLEIQSEFYESSLILDVADDYFHSIGMNKPSADMRTAFTNSIEEFKNFKQLVTRFKVLTESLTKLIRSFETDEYAFRKFSDLINGKY